MAPRGPRPCPSALPIFFTQSKDELRYVHLLYDMPEILL